MKRHIIPIFLVISLVIITLLSIVPKQALAQTIPPAPTLNATKAQITSATFTWINVEEVDAVFTDAAGTQTVQFEDTNGLSHYWDSDPAAPGYTGSVTTVYKSASGSNTCGSNLSHLWANPYYSTRGEQYFHAQIWANDPSVVGNSCRQVNINAGNLTTANPSASSIFYTFSGSNIVRIDGDSAFTFTPSQFADIYELTDSTNSSCPDIIVYNQGVGDAMGNGTLYPMDSISDNTTNISLPAAIKADISSSCNVVMSGYDVNDTGGTLVGQNTKTGAISLHISGTQPAASTTPPGTYTGTPSTGSTDGCEAGQNLYASSTPDNCLMPSCNLSINPETWIICPIVTGGEKLVGQLDNGINSMLDVPVCQYFANINLGNSCTGINQKTSNDFYSAWASFRNIALGIIVIAALIMILAQAIGVEALSAYSFKKMMPRLLIVIIGISVSWYILAFAVQVSNGLGDGIRYLIYSPFTTLNQSPEIMSGGQAAISSLLVAGAGIALGLVGILTLVVTAAISVLTGFGLLMFRDLAIIVFIIMAPVAIACFALPNTEKIWKMWSSNFMKVLLMFPIVAAFIAAGRVFSAILFSQGGTLYQLMAFVVYFAPYFMIPTAFKMAGGIMATAGNVAASVRSRVNQPVAGVRKNMLGKNMQRMQNGTRFQGSNPLARTFNRATSGASLGWKGHLGVGKQGRGALDLKRRAAMRQAIQDNPQLTQLGFDDDAVALMALSGGTRRGAENVAKTFKEKAGWTDDRIARAMGTASAVGFSDINAGASLDIMAQNKSRALGGVLAGDEGMALVRQSATSIAHGNEQLTGNMMGSYAFNSRQAGRLDLGGEAPGKSAQQGWERSTLGQHAQSFTASLQTYGTAFSNDIKNGDTKTRKAAAIALTEMHAMLPNATGANKDVITTALHDAGVELDSQRPIVDQLADISNKGNLPGNLPEEALITNTEINRRARVYEQNVPFGGRGDGADQPPAGANPSAGHP